MEYFAFGETFIEEHKNSHNSPYKFNGKELDEESGLYYYGARYYASRENLWLSVDPIILKDDFFDDDNNNLSSNVFSSRNLSSYTYCYQSPVNLKDPDGENPILGAIFGAVVDYGTQVASNYLNPSVKNKWTDNINLSSIALSAVEGGLTSGGSVAKKLLVKTAVLTTNNIVEFKTNDKGGFEGKVDKNPRNILKNIAVDATVNGVAKGIGDNAIKSLSKAGVHKGSISKAIKGAIKSNGVQVTRELNNDIKTFSKITLNQTGKALENSTKAVTLKPVNDAKDKTNQK
jgi:RHS repeat-associated protein